MLALISKIQPWWGKWPPSPPRAQRSQPWGRKFKSLLLHTQVLYFRESRRIARKAHLCARFVHHPASAVNPLDERLDRVQSNLHVVISELLSLSSICEASMMPLQRVSIRLDSAVLLFLAELRTTHDLLYQARLLVEEAVLGSILANLSSALEVLAQLLACLPASFARSQPLKIALGNLTRLAEDICGSCVPHDCTPRLVFWMDRTQDTSRRIR